MRPPSLVLYPCLSPKSCMHFESVIFRWIFKKKVFLDPIVWNWQASQILIVARHLQQASDYPKLPSPFLSSLYGTLTNNIMYRNVNLKIANECLPAGFRERSSQRPLFTNASHLGLSDVPSLQWHIWKDPGQEMRWGMDMKSWKRWESGYLTES